MKLKHFVLYSLIGVLSTQEALAQAFEKSDYVRALWMATRFYGGQRSGEGPNWLLIGLNNKYQKSFTRDAYKGTDVSGGWFDCGDHVMFGQTQYWSAYTLAKAYEMFPTGFHDLYNGVDYSDYVASDKWNDPYGGTPNGIPDIIDELVYVTDYIAKAAIDENTFVTLKGDGDKDHQRWVTAGQMSLMPQNLGGECLNGGSEKYENDGTGNYTFQGNLEPCTGYGSRRVEADNDKSMASYGAATLAVMSRILTQLNIYPEKASLYYQKALVAYAVAKKSSKSVAYSPFYSANPNQSDDFATAAVEMYKLTGNDTYQSDAKNAENGINKNHNWAFNYNNNDDIAWYNMAESGFSTSAESSLKFYADYYKEKVNSEGISAVGDGSWGTNRYPASGAFIMAAYSKLTDVSNYDDAIYSNVDYMLGKNSSKQSFLTGFQKDNSYKIPLHPHHRGVYMNNTNPNDAGKQAMTIPEKNRSHGSLMGHVGFSSSGFRDDVTYYHSTEVCTDYNVGFVGALAYIVSKLSPTDAPLPPYTPPSSVISEKSVRVQLLRSAPGIYQFSSNAGQAFSVAIYNLQGKRIAKLRSEGASLQYSIPESGIFQAVITTSSSTTSHRLIGDL